MTFGVLLRAILLVYNGQILSDSHTLNYRLQTNNILCRVHGQR
jgi:hypothetical protein